MKPDERLVQLTQREVELDALCRVLENAEHGRPAARGGTETHELASSSAAE
jgi:hypothetical protein